MTDEHYKQAKDVFLTVCDLDTKERAQHLADACGENAELREEVESLLEHYDETRATSAVPLSIKTAYEQASYSG